MSGLAVATAVHGRLVSKLASIATLESGDVEALIALPLRIQNLEAGRDIILQGDAPVECCLVLEGLMCRYNLTGLGERQIVSFHVPGDLPDRDGLHLSAADHGVASISNARVAFIPHGALIDLLGGHPNIGVAFWRDAAIEAAIYRQWLTGVGRRTARQRVAHLICESFTRLYAVGLAVDDHFYFPTTQIQLGDALGLSAVHVNRTLQELRRDGLISWKAGMVTIHEPVALREAADFDETYLRLKPMPGLG